jgi:hypothetical protein
VTFDIDGIPEDRPLIVRAFDPATGRPVSSTARLSGASSRAEAVIAFAEHEGPYRLVVQAEESYAVIESDNASSCDVETPVMPVLSIASDVFEAAEDESIVLTLPEDVGRARYEGAIELCDNPAAQRDAPATLPVALRSRVIQEAEDGTAWSAELSADTQARLDAKTGRYRFCLELMPADYDVIVTPPGNVACALFAEQRLVSAPEDGIATAALLEIPSSAFLVGTLQTQGAMPLQDAIIDAQSLGRETGIELPADARNVTRYSRSSQTVTESDGRFRLPVDVGLYDVTIKPPAASGFSWQVRHDVVIGPRSLDFATVIDMASPVVVQGSLEYSGLDDEAQATLSQAEVTAYALIEGARGEQRAVALGRTTADRGGRFTLLLPPGLHTGW